MPKEIKSCTPASVGVFILWDIKTGVEEQLSPTPEYQHFI